MGNGRIVIGDGCAIQHGVCVVTDGEGRGVIVLEDGASIGYGVHLEADGGRLMIGRDSEVRGHSMVAANGNASVHIGRHSRVAHFVSLKTSHHEIDPSGKCIGGRTIHSDISVGDGCWICAGAIIIPGVAVGEHCVIAAGAVVTHSCEAYSLYAGVPAMHKKSYKEEVMVRMKDVTANE